MKRAALLLLATMFAAPLFADALPIDWFRKRNGLTDAQVDDIFERNPDAVLRMTRGKWMELKYRLHRFDNMRDWLNMQIEGKLGDEILEVTDTNKVLVATNKTLRVAVAEWKQNAEAWYTEATNQTARAESAESDARTLQEVRKAAKRTEKNLSKIVKTLEQAKKKASNEDEANLYQMLAEIIQGVDPNGAQK